MSKDYLPESRELRDGCANRTDVLDKVKALVMLPDDLHVTTEMVAAYYEVGVEAVKALVYDHRAEMEANGYTVLRGDDLRRFKKELPEATLTARQALALFTRRTLLRVGMLLHDSTVAQQVRDYLQDTEEAYRRTERQTVLTLPEGTVIGPGGRIFEPNTPAWCTWTHVQAAWSAVKTRPAYGYRPAPGTTYLPWNRDETRLLPGMVHATGVLSIRAVFKRLQEKDAGSLVHVFPHRSPEDDLLYKFGKHVDWNSEQVDCLHPDPEIIKYARGCSWPRYGRLIQDGWNMVLAGQSLDQAVQAVLEEIPRAVVDAAMERQAALITGKRRLIHKVTKEQ